MIDLLTRRIDWHVRRLEEKGRFRVATLAWTHVRLLVSNTQDSFRIRHISKTLRAGRFPNKVDAAVSAVCTGAVGAGIRPMQLEPELAELIRRVSARRPSTVLEIGTARGGTLCLLCRFAAPDATIVSVDLPYGRNGGGYPRWKEKHYRDFALPGQKLNLIRANSHSSETVGKVRQAVGERRFDFILIDADHSYEGVKTDYLLYAPLASADGLIALHDVLPNLSDPSINVDRFWEELKADTTLRTETLTSFAGQRAFGIGLVSQ